MTRVAIVEIKTGLVVNCADLAGPDDLPPNCSQPTSPPEGYLWVPSDEAAIGWTYADGALVAPVAVAPTIQEEIAAIEAQLNAIDAATKSARWIRELALGVNESWNMLRASSLPSLPPAGSGMQKVAAIEAQCAVLREQRAELAAKL